VSDSFLDFLQWPAVVTTLLAAWLVASQRKRRRSAGFWIFILSNVLWAVWGWHVRAHSLIALQVGLFVLNVRGARKNEPEEADSGSR
jgi:sugar phosphate permease